MCRFAYEQISDRIKKLNSRLAECKAQNQELREALENMRDCLSEIIVVAERTQNCDPILALARSARIKAHSQANIER